MEVRDVGVALWRQRPLVVLILVITGVAVAAGVMLAPKSYAATATVSAAERPGAAASSDDPDALRATLAELANAGAVVDEVQDRVRADRDVDQLRRSIQGHWIRGTILVDITVEDRDPDTAASIANTVAAVLVEGEVTEEVAGPTLDDLVLTTTDGAEPPATFSRPDRRFAFGIGLLLAVGLATVGAVLRDRRTHTVHDAAGVEEAATAPLLAHLASPGDLTAMPALSPGTAEADLFRHLRVALESSVQSGAPPRVVVAGVTNNDVNVWLAANIAISLAGIGRRVLLVDGRMGERFGTPVEQAPDTPGLYDVLVGADLETAMSPGPIDLLRVLPAGTWGDEPIPELLAQRFPAVMEAAEAEFDHVVVLGPPLEICDDSRVMAIDCSMVLAVVESSVSSSALRAHADRVRAVGARLLGVVLVGRHPARAAA